MGLAGCSTPAPRAANGNATIHLTATLVSPIDIVLNWQDNAPDAAGHIVEWTSDLKDDYVILGFVPANTNTFLHPNLMPETTCHYRVRAYFGPASSPVEITLPEGLSDSEYATRFDAPEEYHWAIPTTIPGDPKAVKKSIRNAGTVADAAPTDLKGALMPITVSGFKLTWTDNASDEDGYLVEMKPEGSPDFKVCAILGRDINSFGYAFEPPQRKGAFRVRAFYFGKPSNLVSKTTGAAPPDH